MDLRRIALACVAVASCLVAVPAEAASLKAPKLSSPADGASVQTLPPFEWGKVAGAEKYEFQVAADARFGSIITKRGFRTGNTVATVTKAAPNGNYFWRVRGIDKAGKAGPWSVDRDLIKAWDFKPALSAPTGGLAVNYPSEPLILRWGDVDHATKYLVTIASDPSLAQLVVNDKPIETSATGYTIPGALAPGAYYWAVQPVNAQGHKGARSDVGKFVWGWNSGVSLSDPAEMRADARVSAPVLSDPELSWAAVPGASAYEVQVNFFESFSAGSMVQSAKTIGTRFSPTVALPNNTYYWRVRPLDVNGNESGWSPTKTFTKSFDTLAPTVPGLRVRDNEADPFRDRGTQDELPIVQHPLFDWESVPGASGYEIQTAEYKTSAPKFCDWSNSRWARTANTAWSPIANSFGTTPPGVATWGPPIQDLPTFHDPQFVAGKPYCVRVLAIANFKNHPYEDDILSEWTYIHNGPGAPASKVSTGSNSPAFVYEAPAQPALTGDSAQDVVMNVDDYQAPAAGSGNGETPVLRWKAVPGARSYWVIIARDEQFTNVPEIVLTHQPQHAPRTTFRDESTAYWWVVVPARQLDGSEYITGISDNSKRSFNKSSASPELLEPSPDALIGGQPRFHWKGALGAKKYKLQVSTDATFKDSARELDTVMTTSTAYTPTKTYPADTVLYWRVTAIAVDRREIDIELKPSEPGTFRRTLPVPTTAGDNPLGGSAIPSLRWAPVPGAVGYDVHVDQADGRQKDFKTSASAFTPTAWYGIGVWRWQVRAVFPGDAHGAYGPPVPFARFIPAPGKAQAERSKDRVLIRWEGLRNVRNYKIEIATDSSFGTVVDSADMDGNAYAPDTSGTAFQRGGTLFWRVAAVDEGNNIGAYANGTLTLSRRLVVTSTGKARRRRTVILTVQVADAGRKSISGAKLTLKGAGVKITRKTPKSGRVALRIRPRKKGTITITATKKGYSAGSTKLRVR
jgi:hypothetical protein